MLIVKREIEQQVEKLLGKNKVLLILGTRRVGKTFLINAIRQKYKDPVVVLNGEDFEVQKEHQPTTNGLSVQQNY